MNLTEKKNVWGLKVPQHSLIRLVNGDGTTNCLFMVKMAGRLGEATPALYRGRAYVLSTGGYFYAIE